MLKIIMEDMPKGEVAALYQDGPDAVVLVSRALPDDVRCSAVNDLLRSVSMMPPPKVSLSLVS